MQEQKDSEGPRGKILGPEDLGTFYATEIAQLPTIKCPHCDSDVTDLYTLLANQQCENCGAEIEIGIKWVPPQ